MPILKNHEKHTSPFDQINPSIISIIKRFFNKDLDIIKVKNKELHEYLIKSMKMIHTLFGLEYLYSGLKAIFYEAYDDVVLNVAIAFTFFILIKLKLTTKINIIRIFLYLFIILNFYQSSFYGMYAGIQYNYLNLLLVIPFTFDIKVNLKEIILIVLLCVSSIMINVATDFTLFLHPRNTLEVQDEIFHSQIIILIINFLFFLYIILLGTKLLFQIHGNPTENIDYKTAHNDTHSKDFKELEHLALSSPSAFIVRFNEVFPHFCTSLQSRFPDLSKGELEICCYLKMNFSTKDIAIATNSSVRSIDSKKYRLRKKLNLDSSEKIYQFFIGREEF